MKFYNDFKNSPLDAFAKWQDERFLWILMAVTMLALVILAHNFFQNYLFMAPCEQCVYIRFSMLVMALGGIIAAINPKKLALKFSGYVLGIYGAIIGIMYSVKLHKIHVAIHGDDLFGVQGCSTNPHFPFGLPLAKLAPNWFAPTGDCGYDAPIVPSGVELDFVQEFFIKLYADGWYLVPSLKFMDMAQCTLIAYIVALTLLFLMLLCFVVKKIKAKN